MAGKTILEVLTEKLPDEWYYRLVLAAAIPMVIFAIWYVWTVKTGPIGAYPQTQVCTAAEHMRKIYVDGVERTVTNVSILNREKDRITCTVTVQMPQTTVTFKGDDERLRAM